MKRRMLGWLVMSVYLTAAAQALAASPWTAVLTQQAMASGYKSTLPPHIAMVLGLSPKGESVAVRQLVSRADHKVRTFNVSVANPRDLVIFSVDEGAQQTVAYLVTPAGKLRKAVAYHTGGEPRDLPAEQARPGLAREVRYWSAHAAESAPQPASPANPPAAPAPAH